MKNSATTLRRLDYFEFMELCPESGGSLLLEEAQEAYANGGAVYALQAGENVVSLAFVLQEGEDAFLNSVYTLSPYRWQGFACCLLRELRRQLDMRIRLCLAEGTPQYKGLEQLCLRAGFVPAHAMLITTITRAQLQTWGDSGVYRRYCNFRQRYLAKGFVLQSLAEAPQEIVTQVAESSHNSFQSQINVEAYLSEPTSRLRRDLSFVLSKDGEAVSFILLREAPGGKRDIAITSTAASYLGRGHILLPALAAFEAVLREKGVKYVEYCDEEDNGAAISFQAKFFDGIACTRNRFRNFYGTAEEGL